MTALGSRAAPDCRTGQSKGRYRARVQSQSLSLFGTIYFRWKAQDLSPHNLWGVHVGILALPSMQMQFSLYCLDLQFPILNCNLNKHLQGQSWQTVFLELAWRDRNIKIRFIWEVVLKSWDLRNFASATSFHKIYTVCHLRSNLQTCKKNFGKKDFECNYCKATS